MKKHLLLSAALMLSISSFAQSYRGMLDIYGGFINPGKENLSAPGMQFESKPFMGGLFTTSHGAQITPFLFIGAGGGVNLQFGQFNCVSPTEFATDDNFNDLYAVTIPAFLDARWDLDVRKKVTPFVDVKVGYQLRVGDGLELSRPYGGYGTNSPYDEYWLDSQSSVYFQPTVGVRFKGGRRTGFNLGVSYNTTVKRNLYGYDRNLDKKELLDSATDGVLMLNIGLDF